MAAPAQTRQTAEDDTVPVPFSEAAYEVLRQVAAKKGTSVVEAIREALAFSLYLDEALDQGGRVIIERPDRTRETFTRRR